MPLIITDTPTRPFEKCALDIVGLITVTTNENKYILTFQDNLTKFSKAISLANQEVATVAKEFVTKIVFEHGMPEKILTNQGTNFTSEMFKNACKLLKIEKIQTSAYHPESNGALEHWRTTSDNRRHGNVSGIKYIERYREIYDAREGTVYLYASRRDAST